MILRQLHRQVRAQGIGVVQGFQPQGVELFLPGGKHGDMLLPVLHAAAIPGDAHGLENSIPELLHGLLLRHAGEYAPGPGGDGDGGDAPGEAAAHLQTVILLQSLTAGAQGTHPAIRVHTLEMLWILGINDQIGRARPGVVIEKMLTPQGHLVKHSIIGAEKFLTDQIVVVPVHHHLPAACVIGCRGAHAGKKGALHRAGDEQGLASLHMQAHLNQELCVLVKLFVRRFHRNTSLS